MLWVYVLALSDGGAYVGRTSHLISRLNDHFHSDAGGAKATRRWPPTHLLAAYRVRSDDEADAAALEDEMTLSMMKARGRGWCRVKGGRFTDDFHVHDHAKDFRPKRPLCRCRLPADGRPSPSDPSASRFSCPKRSLGRFWTDTLAEAGFVREGDVACGFFAEAPVAGAEFEYDPPPLPAGRPSRIRFDGCAFVDADDTEGLVREALDRIGAALESGNAISLSAKCNARNCACYDARAFYDAEAHGIDEKLRYRLQGRSLVAGDVKVQIDFLEEEATEGGSPSARRLLLSAREAIAAPVEEGHVFLDDRRPHLKAPYCAWLDERGASLPTVVFARNDAMKACLGCGSRYYKAVSVDGRRRRLCRDCVIRADVEPDGRLVVDGRTVAS